MKTTFKYFLIAFCSLLLFACGGQGYEDSTNLKNEFTLGKTASNSSDDYNMVEEEGGDFKKDASEQRESDNLKTENEKTIERKLIKEGNIRFETQEIEPTLERVHKAVKAHNGYISNENSYKYTNSSEYTITVRMPANNFDAFLAAVTEGVDELENKNIQVKDVTEEFVDIQARLKTKRQLETRYTDLLAKANSVEEILKVEKELGTIRAEIESAEGRLKYLKDRVAYSTLTIDFYKKTVSSIGFGGKFGRGLNNGWNNLLWFLVGLVNIWPFILLVGGFIWWLVWRLKKRRRNNNSI